MAVAGAPVFVSLFACNLSMSIAVSAVVYPSVRLRLLLAAFGIVTLTVAMVMLLSPGRYAALPALSGAGASALCGLFLLLSAARGTDPQRLDISGVGQIRLTVYLVSTPVSAPVRAPERGTGALPVAGSDLGETLLLMPGSTLWPGLLLLLLQGADGRVRVLPVWPGSVAPGVFRPLSIACRSLAARMPRQ